MLQLLTKYGAKEKPAEGISHHTQQSSSTGCVLYYFTGRTKYLKCWLQPTNLHLLPGHMGHMKGILHN